MSTVAGVVLAAGPSSRLGRPKQLLDWGGVPLVAHVVRTAIQAGLQPVVVVVGASAVEVLSALERTGLASLVRTVMNWRWQEGMGASLRAGLAALPPQTEGAVLLHCDQPLVSAELLKTLVARFNETGAPIVQPVGDGRCGPPVLFARSLFAELAALTGDLGGRVVIEQHRAAVHTLPVDDPYLLADIDTPEDYVRLQQHAQNGSRATPLARLAHIRHLICDMDGVLWHGDRALPGLQEFFEFLHSAGVRYILATNNSSRTPEQYTQKLAGFGVQVSLECILTSSQVAASYLAGRAAPGTRVYAIGEDGLRVALQEQGFVLGEEGAEYVVVGWDRHLTWDKLATATLLIHQGAGFIGTNPDSNYPTERGPAPGNGAQLAALATATGVRPIVVGKPEPTMYQEAMRRMGARPETTAVLGDRLDTDIAGGVPLGLTTVLLLSGIATREMLATSPFQPDFVFEGLPDLLEAWRGQTACA